MAHLHQEIQYAQNEGMATGVYIAFSIAFFFSCRKLCQRGKPWMAIF